mgnify:CR=1 FL=1
MDQSKTINLNIGSGSQAQQTAKAMLKIEELLIKLDKEGKKPDAVIVYGDTNATPAGALAAVKLEIPVIHIEAGMRSGNFHQPEEINRRISDHISSLLFTTGVQPTATLHREGICEGVYNVGDVHKDSFLRIKKKVDDELPLSALLRDSGLNEDVFLRHKFILVTIHRPANTKTIENFDRICQGLKQLAFPIIWPLHPRTRKLVDSAGYMKQVPANVHLIEPLSYPNLVRALIDAHSIITDSGGLQVEAYWLRKRLITMRAETEWTETLAGGWNVLCGNSISCMLKNFHRNIDETKHDPLFGGSGKSADTIAKILKSW